MEKIQHSPNYKAGKRRKQRHIEILAHQFAQCSWQSAGQVNDRQNSASRAFQCWFERYGFIPQRGTVYAAMAFKVITEENLKQNNCTSVVSFDVRGAFDVAWWPSILRNLKELKCPQNLFNRSRSYFSNRMALLREYVENRETRDYRVPSRFLQRSRVLVYTLQLV